MLLLQCSESLRHSLISGSSSIKSIRNDRLRVEIVSPPQGQRSITRLCMGRKKKTEESFDVEEEFSSVDEDDYEESLDTEDEDDSVVDLTYDDDDEYDEYDESGEATDEDIDVVATDIEDPGKEHSLEFYIFHF